MSNIAAAHAESGLMRTTVLCSERSTEHMTRVTFAGEDLHNFRFRGFDQWFRLAIPVGVDARFDNLPARGQRAWNRAPRWR
ncbi:siderophore-interacting protein [Glutamicibacter sp. MNS18]|uniref:siderophore-interacting protein n=1 Tax=Glutamicibacter sp. MNS18 TaxID=2989817 RepID=UPI0022360642|nr:siderophore-interacting protein [Glutamicibacter sp. MNS18]MCW4464998.1 siderophore-interacting protein [Glutamicibacter sp. MNS18]